MAFYRCGGGADTSGVTASAEDVLASKVIVNADGEPLTGTMANQGAKTAALNCGESYSIPEGYHNGGGKVKANSLASQTPGTATASGIDKGTTAWVNGSKITGTKSVTIDGAEVPGKLELVSNPYTIMHVDTFPNDFSAVIGAIHNNELHLFGYKISSSTTRCHYKWDGTTWTSVSTPPYGINMHSSVVIYNNEIHILGGLNISSSIQGGTPINSHYKWDGTTWTSVSTIPIKLFNASAVVYNNEIHILGGSSSTGFIDNSSEYAQTYHYKWNGTTWSSVSTLPGKMSHNFASVYNGSLYAFIYDTYSNTKDRYLYKWNKSSNSWTRSSSYKLTMISGASYVVNGNLYAVGYDGSSFYDYDRFHNYKIDVDMGKYEEIMNFPADVRLCSFTKFTDVKKGVGAFVCNATHCMIISKAYDIK